MSRSVLTATASIKSAVAVAAALAVRDRHEQSGNRGSRSRVEQLALVAYRELEIVTCLHHEGIEVPACARYRLAPKHLGPQREDPQGKLVELVGCLLVVDMRPAEELLGEQAAPHDDAGRDGNRLC